jgi:Putative zincin peptidase
MRFHLGSIPDEFTPDGSWRPIREPGPAVMQLFAVPIGVGMAALVMYSWHRIGVSISLHVESSNAAFFRGCLLLSVPALIVVHELLHAVVHPDCGRSPSTIIGAWPSRLLFYAHYSGPLSRNRFVAVLAMPFVVITVLPLAVAATGLLPTGVTMAAAWFSTCNALFACGDYFGIGLILAQVPRSAIVQNKSWRTYWKPS